MDKTVEIFELMVAESIAEGVHGLSAETSALFPGDPNRNVMVATEFVQQVTSLCNCFTDFVSFQIKTLEEKVSDNKASDLKVLYEMVNWTFDADKVEALAREEWEKCRMNTVAGLTTSPVISQGEFSF